MREKCELEIFLLRYFDLIFSRHLELFEDGNRGSKHQEAKLDRKIGLSYTSS